MELKTGCHGYLMLLNICRWVVYKVNYGIFQKIIVIIIAVVQHMRYLIGFGTYNSEGIKVHISPNYSTTLGLKTGCHGYFMLLDICRWVVYKALSKLR